MRLYDVLVVWIIKYAAGFASGLLVYAYVCVCVILVYIDESSRNAFEDLIKQTSMLLGLSMCVCALETYVCICIILYFIYNGN